MDPLAGFEIVVLVIIGLLAGLLGGLIGIGGSIVLIPAMTELLGEHQHLYQATAMIVNFFVAVPACYQHVRAGAVMRSVVARMIPAAAAAVLLGVWISERPIFRDGGQAYLIVLLGVFILCVGVRSMMQTLRPSSGADTSATTPKPSSWMTGLLAGGPTGFIAGMLGVGGGIVAVPLQTRFLKIPLRNAISNSAATIIALSLVGAFSKNYALAVHHTQYGVDTSLLLAAILIPGAFAGSLVGSRLTHVLPVRTVRGVFSVFFLVASLRMMYRGIVLLNSM